MKRASLNHIYRLVWNEITRTYVAVAENTSARGKRSSAVAGALIASALLSGGAMAQSLPSGGTITAGRGNISYSGNQMTVTQDTSRLVTNWNAFNIGKDSSVRFNQPDANSIALNRVIGGSASSIQGKLSANGNVWLLNPNGVVIGQTAQINVGGLVASSLNMSDTDFLAGRNRFTGGAGAGAVVNNGSITAAGGVVALIAPRVSNTGSISTPSGSTVLAAGDTVNLDFVGDGLVSVNVEKGVVDAAAENSGRISADGGLVALTARGADAVMNSIVNNTGVIEARGLVARNGRILLDGDAAGGDTHVSGTLDASSANGTGGNITVTGKHITLDGGATLDASGATGGGSIAVGGGRQGGDASIANATTLTADSSVVATADATRNGDGGSVVFWSDDTTRFSGDIFIRGGAQGGNGGQAEVSGKQSLAYSGITNALAAHGQTGGLLLDPSNITIIGGGAANDGSIGTNTVTEKALENQAADVLILTSDGNITVADLSLNGGDGTITMQQNVSLRLEAGNATSTGDATNHVISFANANNTIEVSGTGSIYMQAGGYGKGSLNNIGNLVADGPGDNPDPADLVAHDVRSHDENGAGGKPGAGTITLLGADGLTVAGTLTTHGGYVRLSSNSDTGTIGALNLSTNITTNGGNLYLSFGNDASSIATISGDVNVGTGRLLFGNQLGNNVAINLGSSLGEKRLAGTLELSGDVDFDTPLTMLGGASIFTDGTITFSSTVNLDTGDDALTLRAKNVDFSAAELENVSTASLILEPFDQNADIVVHGADGIARASTLDPLEGIKNLTIGRADGTGTTTLEDDFSFGANNMIKLLNGSIDVNHTFENTSATGHIIAASNGGDVTLEAGSKITAHGTGDAIVLAATDGDFINDSANADVLDATHDGSRWLVYSTNPANDVRGALDNQFKQYNANYGGTANTDTVLGTGNGFLYTVAPIIDGTLTGTTDKTYDGNSTVTDTGSIGVQYSGGALDGDQVSLQLGDDSAATYGDKNAGGGKNVNATGVEISSATDDGVQVFGYQVKTTAQGDIGTIDKRALTVNDGVSATAADKVYDGNSNATVTGVTFNNVVGEDDLAGTGTGTFDSKNVGNGKTVTVSGIQLSGDDAQNYEIDSSVTATAQADITPKHLTGTADVGSKVYDGGTAAQLSNVVLDGVVAGDEGKVAAAGTGTFNDKNVGNDKGVTGSGVGLSGDEAGNYVFDTDATIGTGDITPKHLTGTASVDTKVYDGSTSAQLGGVTLVGVVDGDAGKVNATGSTGTFNDKNVGTDKGVTGSGIGLAGDEAGNYVFDTDTQIGTGDITPKHLTGTASVDTKVYDGGTAAQLSNVVLDGVVAGDEGKVAAAGTGTFNNKNVGTDKGVTGSGVGLSGDEAGNYVFDTDATIGTGDITPKHLTGTASVDTKVYDGSTSAQLGGVTLVGVVDGDAGKVNATGSSGTFNDKNVGTDKGVSGSGIGLAGDEAGNYVFDTDATIGTGDITPKHLTGTASVDTKVYDGSTSAQLGGVTLVGVVDGDAGKVNATGSSGTFSDKNVGTDKGVTGSGIGLAGDEAGNYVFDTDTQIGTGDITPKHLTGTASVDSKVYDGGTTAQLGGVTLVGVVDGDAGKVNATGSSGTFNDKNVGTDKGVTGSGIGLSGDEAGNYVFDTDATIGTGDITPKHLTGTASVDTKVYDGSTSAQLGGVTLVGVVDGDQGKVNATGSSGTFNDRNVGTDKGVTGSGIGLAGDEAGNYVFDTDTQIGTGDITPKHLTGSASVDTKVYDGSTAAQLGGVTLVGVVSGDEGKVAAAGTGTFNDKNVGNDKGVTGSGVGLTGDEAGNYVFDTDATIGTGDITPKHLTGSASVDTKVYDGSTSAQLGGVTLVGVVDGDTGKVNATGSSGTFNDKNVGNDKGVSGSGIGLAGDEAGNYVFDTDTQIGTGDITPKHLTGTASVDTKVYDGSTTAQLGGVTLVGVVDGDAGKVNATGSSGTFNDKNVGTDKGVSGSGIGLAGDEAGNYVFDTDTQIGTGDITPKHLTGTASVDTKVYDGGTAAQLGGVTLVGVVDGDAGKVNATGSSGTFNDKNVGNDKGVSGSGIGLAGDEAGNYVFDTDTQIGTGDITPKHLTGTASVDTKVYDGGTAAQLGGVTLVGVVDGDAGKVNATGSSGTFNDKNVGNDKGVTGSGIGLAGDEAGNYVFDTDTQIGTGDITPKHLTGTASVDTKVYDGSTAAQLGGVTLVGVVDGDTGKVNATGSSGTFSDKNVGTDKGVTGSGIGLAGDEAGNYVFDTDAAIGTGDITPKHLTGTASVDTKVYDGSTGAQLGDIGLVGVIDSDKGKVNTTGSTGSFDNKNVGNDKDVTGSGIGLAGDEAGNYVFDTDAKIGTGDVTPKTITGTADVAGKVYDGNTNASLGNIGLVGVIDGDNVNASGTGSFDNKNVGKDKAVTGSGVGLSGGDAGNYVFDNGAVVGTGDVTPKTLDVTGVSVSDKEFDGTTAAQVGGLDLSGIVAGDQVAGNGGSGQFDTPNVGSDKPVSVTGLQLTGDDAGNYVLGQAGVQGKASITQKPENPATAALTAKPVGANGTAVAAERVDESVVTIVADNALDAPSFVSVSTGTTPNGAPTTQGLVLPDAILTGSGQLSLAIENGVAASPIDSSLPVYSTRPGQAGMKTDGEYEVTDSGNAVALALAGAVTHPTPVLQQAGARTAEASIALASGSNLVLYVTLQTDGILTVQVPPAGSNLSSDAITAYALAIAKKQFDISVKDVKAVVVEYGTQVSGLDSARVALASH